MAEWADDERVVRPALGCCAARTGELTIEQPGSFEVVINLRAAHALALASAECVRQRADEVIR